MQEVMLFATVLLPIISALVELVKKTVIMPKTLLPLVSLGLGLAIGAASYPFTDLDTVMRLWAGGLAGLAGTGLFELIKKDEGFTKEDDLNG